MFQLFVTVLTVFIFLLLPSMGQEIFHWFLPVGVHVRVSKSDADDGVSIALPLYLNEDVTSCLQYVTPLM